MCGDNVVLELVVVVLPGDRGVLAAEPLAEQVFLGLGCGFGESYRQVAEYIGYTQ